MKTFPRRYAVDAGGDYRPALLMLSHCLPDPAGVTVQRRRAWQLLTMASEYHRVFLACRCDAPLHLSQWRRLRQHAHLVLIAPSSPLIEWCGRRIGFPAREMNRLAHLNAPHPLDAVLCTTTRFFPFVASIDAARRFVDVDETDRPGVLLSGDERDRVLIRTDSVRDAWRAAGFPTSITIDEWGDNIAPASYPIRYAPPALARAA